MNQNLFTYLPSEIIIEILSELPIRTIICCKCVCKSWHGLLETDEFVKTHISKAIPGLVVDHNQLHMFFEFEDGHYNPVTKFKLPFCGLMNGSVNGLLCIGASSYYVCNPITRDYINLHIPQDDVNFRVLCVVYGFGVSIRNGQYKVVKISQENLRLREIMCHVYTLGTGSWRRVESSVPLFYKHHRTGTFLKGNLHWLADINDSQHCVSCFDLETELFSTLSLPPIPFPPLRARVSYEMCSLKGCLCLCDSSSVDEIRIWLMMEYGVKESWTRVFVVCKAPGLDSFVYEGYYEFLKPIKVLKNGDVLMVLEHDCLYYYSKEKNTTQKIDLFEGDINLKAMVYTPSFLSLKRFEMENVDSF